MEKKKKKKMRIKKKKQSPHANEWIHLSSAILWGEEYNQENLNLMSRRKKYHETLRNAKNKKCQNIKINVRMKIIIWD